MKNGFLLFICRAAPYVILTAAILLAAVRVSTALISERQLPNATVTDRYLPVRSSPTMVTATIAQLFEGDDVKLTGVRSADGRWVQVKMPGVKAGWIPADALRVQIPIADLAVTDDPTLARGQEYGGVAIVTVQRSPVLESPASTSAVITQLARGERLQLTGYRTADAKWVQVILSGSHNGWMDADSIASDYPLSALIEYDAFTRD